LAAVLAVAATGAITAPAQGDAGDEVAPVPVVVLQDAQPVAAPAPAATSATRKPDLNAPTTTTPYVPPTTTKPPVDDSYVYSPPTQNLRRGWLANILNALFKIFTFQWDFLF
jgi:hypothetical protein